MAAPGLIEARDEAPPFGRREPVRGVAAQHARRFLRMARAALPLAGDDQHHARAGGLLAQFLPEAPERRQADQHPGDAPAGVEIAAPREDEAWLEAKALASTVEDHELVDPTLSGERLLYRLFHERGVKVFSPQPVVEQCRCSSERIEAMLKSFTPQERRDMIGDDGKISVTCEFCSTTRVYEPSQFADDATP